MKKFLIGLIILILIISISFIFIKQNKNEKLTETENKEISTYIKDIYNIHYSIPEFNNINEADEFWLWDNINQYLSNHEEFEERNIQGNYTYKEISNFAKTLYGKNFTLKVPIQNPAMIYYENSDTYGIPSYTVNSFKECQIESIEKKDNLYIVNIIDYTISFNKPFDSTSEDKKIYFYNSTDYNLNSNSSDIIFELSELKNYKDKILKNKNKFTSKTLTLSYDGKYHIQACKNNYSDENLIREKYSEMKESFNLYNLEYDINELYNSSSAEITNFNDISSIYTENGLEIYKNTFNLLTFKDNTAFINAGDFYAFDNVFSSKFSNIIKKENEITCTVTSYLYDSTYDINNLSDLIQINNEFKLIKENNTWKIDYFNIDFSNN